MELVYEAGEPLGLSARLFDRPPIDETTLVDRVLSQACVVTAVTLPAKVEREMTVAELFHACGRPHRADSASACAFIYRALKVWTVVGGEGRPLIMAS